MNAAPTIGGERGGAQKMGRLDGVPSVEAGAGNHCVRKEREQRARKQGADGRLTLRGSPSHRMPTNRLTLPPAAASSPNRSTRSLQHTAQLLMHPSFCSNIVRTSSVKLVVTASR